VLKTSCTGAETIVSGKLTVTATKKLSGRLTGDRDQPVVPINDTPATINVEEASFDGFTVDQDGKALTIARGTLGGTVAPRTAMDSAIGACAFETPIARFSNVRYGANTQVELRAAQGTFEAVIDDSNLAAVNGTWGADSNMLDGTITVAGKSYTLPAEPNDDGLDPEFEQAAFNAAWQCGTLDAAAPFECTFVRPLAQGAAQLTIRALGTIAELIENDTRCGFSNNAVIAGVEITGALGDRGGSAVFTIGAPCELSFSMPAEAESDCNGLTTMVRGTARVRGTKRIEGFVSGDPAQPIVPTSRDPATLALETTFTDFEVWTVPGDRRLTIHSGTLAGTIRPRTAIDETTGACSIATPVARLEGVGWREGALTIESEGKTFDLDVAAASLEAVNGARDGVSNDLRGTITVDGEQVSIPISPELGLDPDYDPNAFDASYACTPNLRVPASEEDCNMKKPLGEGAARLLVQALGAVTSVTNEDNDCGYSANLTDPSTVVGEPGQMGYMEWEIENCELARTGRDATRPYATDCLDRRAFMAGTAVVSGVRHVEGLREEIGFLSLNFDSIKPTTRESVLVNQRNILLVGFSNYELDPGENIARRAITVHQGAMTALVQPITGERADDPGRFDVPTKVVRMTSFAVTGADLTIRSEGKTFNLHVDQAMLSAFNGSYATTGEKNTIGGEITVEGQTIVIPPSPLQASRRTRRAL
jgi:hypothetical protein